MPAGSYYGPKRQLVQQGRSYLTQPPEIPRSTFTGKWQRLTTFNAGDLVPFLIEEVYPGDHMRFNTTIFTRMATPSFPIFSNQNLETFYFFVPLRLVWDNFVKMMGEQDNPGDSIAYTVPTINSGGNSVNGAAVTPGSIWDQFGIPQYVHAHSGSTFLAGVSALPFRAYNLIYNYWFRDQNWQNSVPFTKGDVGGSTDAADFVIRQIAKYHDYFTSLLPAPQKGANVVVPLQGFAPISGLGSHNVGAADGVTYYENPDAHAGNPGPYTYAHSALWNGGGFPGQWAMHTDGSGNITTAAALAATGTGGPATGFTILALRNAFQIQTLLERDNRGGTRYPELVRAQFGAINPDFRLQRPEYIGGGRTPIMVTPVAQTAPSSIGSGSVVGQLAAAGTGAGSHHASYAATEHGLILGILAVRTELNYQQGLRKLFSRSTRYDFYNPAFALTSDQPVYEDEIQFGGVAGPTNSVFGFKEPWHELRDRYGEVTGMFNSDGALPIDQWHLAQAFGVTPPVMGDTFIKDTPPMARVLAAGSNANGQQYLADILTNYTYTRPVPAFGTPAQLGRF